MRKTLIAALAALTALALTAVAFAQNRRPPSMSRRRSARRRPARRRSRSPRSSNLTITNNRESKTSAAKIEIQVPKSLKLSTKGLKSCSVVQARRQGKAACPKGSLAGIGTAEALAEPDSATRPR